MYKIQAFHPGMYYNNLNIIQVKAIFQLFGIYMQQYTILTNVNLIMSTGIIKNCIHSRVSKTSLFAILMGIVQYFIANEIRIHICSSYIYIVFPNVSYNNNLDLKSYSSAAHKKKMWAHKKSFFFFVLKYLHKTFIFV